jgi:L-ribulokinase
VFSIEFAEPSRHHPSMSNANAYTVGLDYGTNSVRCLIVRTSDGAEAGTHISGYPHGDQGVILDPRDPDLARQHPTDYLTGAEAAVRGAIAAARAGDPGFAPERVIGLGVDTTGSTPLPVDAQGRPLAEQAKFSNDPNAMAWLWKDHTGTAEARAITQRAADQHPEYLRKCGGVYSSEWFWSKIWHCAKVAPNVAAAAASWIECADWIPAVLTGTEATAARCICAAGHKAMYHEAWGGYPAEWFLATLHPELGRLRSQLGTAKAVAIDQSVGGLTAPWAGRLGLPAGIPVAAGAFDAHLGAVGSGIAPGTLVKILGTSTCDIMIAPLRPELPDIPGLCGIVPGSVLPRAYGLEAGQSAVGDIFNWWVQQIQPGGGASHDALSAEAAKLAPGETGLLALDWNNGNRTVLVDQRLTGLLLGQTLQTRPAEVYRALIEATAFGARIIIERFEEYGVRVERVVACGGIAEKSPLVMQIYANVTGRPMQLSRSAQTCALGAAIAAAVVAKGYPDVPAAQRAMTGIKSLVYEPEPKAVAVYQELFALYRCLHDGFGLGKPSQDLAGVMKKLLALRDRVRHGGKTP